ncbi:hypothetical protein T05_13192 [Trichinella murrelli]|uniref:Uncharacterized protein n=1 Tax=Trichinella murrelli TaxID=144512 RepID=A0A0V0TAP2_9BILA|nr:hypothetical protein T05_13192 [Trichinella murrelli]
MIKILLLRTERHRPRRCDLPMGWCPKVADRASTMPAPRRPDRYLRLLAAPGWGQRGPLRRPRLTVAR